MQIVALIPNIKPLLLTVKAGLILIQIIEVDESVRAIALSSAIISVQFTPADALPLIRLLPCEFIWLELRSFV